MTRKQHGFPREHISRETGFDAGERFSSDAEVLAYFTTDNMEQMFPGEPVPSQAVLSAFAADVIANRWHYDGGAERCAAQERG
jgi:hypothetical protein